MDLTIKDLYRMQEELREKYKEKWGPLTPEVAVSQLLWGVGEMGEVIDVIKKHSLEELMEDAPTREHFIEETVDVFMYLIDVLKCFDVKPEEFSGIYAAKHAHNMKRRFAGTDYSEET